MTDWEPATDAESHLRDALRVGDQERYFRILSRMELLLPVSAEALAGRAPTGWGTWTSAGRTHVLAFTSAQALQACLAGNAGSARPLPYQELAAAWPNHEWWLAVNPGLPIEGYLPAWFVAQLARGDVRLPGRSLSARARSENAGAGGTTGIATLPTQTAPEPATDAVVVAVSRSAEPGDVSAANGHSRVPLSTPRPDFHPANPVEQALYDAADGGNTDTFLSTLLLANVLLPVSAEELAGRPPADPHFDWQIEEIEDERYIVVFTSPKLFDDHIGAGSARTEVKFVTLIQHWPDSAVWFAVNPGSPIGATLPGDQVIALAQWAVSSGLGVDEPSVAPAAQEASAEPVPAGPEPAVPLMQKVIPPAQVPYYLERGYDRVSGFVHRSPEVQHLRTPAELFEAFGLGYEGSLFRSDADEAYVIEWVIYRPGLYRIPYGGNDDASMNAMRGWVIERPPFKGNGFAPSATSEIIAEFKVDSARLPHGATMWRLANDGTRTLVATLDADGPRWVLAEEGAP